ncbi:pfs domain-containing protein [Colletotrichum sojae]|uniref:Pfs domain-containing protein n=1 Tax=Colletotrichum sojae TaxID=2175907 RepID=A0A8H6MIL7_9PEZI|nr:pfs domain-containing protein [Colletotrichum sojae]
MPAPEEFTVGWICALSNEYVAARAFLDETYEDQGDRAPGDDNDYTLGRIKGHNVVVAVMPDGDYSTASAAGVARDMCRTFVNLQIHLMVGIGGGAPSKRHDVRLGDIVVSTPRDGKGGVFQYDFGKTIQDRAFQPTGFLNQPPRVVRAAVNGLKAEYESDGHQLEAAVEGVLDKKSRLKRNYKRPEPSSDRLYRSDFIHQDDEASCSEACGDDPSNLVRQSERDADDNLVIHYDLIASANQLMKDAVIRDELARSMGVMCFEMEAAGLMNNFPCLVIRGICDYADTHKNKARQGYTAMVAAAYAKDLLCRIKPVKVEVDSKFLDALNETGATVREIQSQLADDEDLRILEWLTPVDYSLQQSESLRKRQEGTCNSHLASPRYQDWLSTSGQKLFCHGMPGAGKNIFASTVI